MSLVYDTSVSRQAGGQWFKCQQQRGYRSIMFTVIEKIQGADWMWWRYLSSVIVVSIFRSLNSLGIYLFHVYFYLVPKKKDEFNAMFYQFFSLILLQVWLELLKPITKQVKSKYGKLFKEYNSQLKLTNISVVPHYSSH